MKFTIETVSKMTGIPAPSLRNWEKRYGFPTPERTSGGHRFYTARDVEFLKKASKWIEEGHSLNEIAKLYMAPRTEPEAAGIPVRSPVIDDVSYRVELIYEALLKFDQMATLQHYATLSVKLSVEQLFDRVFETILTRLYEDRMQERITLAQEHFAIAFVRLKLSTFLSLDFPPTQEARIVFATPLDERYEGDIMLMAAHLKFRGYPIYYFGINIPLDELKSVIEDIRPSVVCLSYQDEFRLQRDLKGLSHLKVPVSLTGLAIKTGELEALSSNILLCLKDSSGEAAQFVEMICQSQSSKRS